MHSLLTILLGAVVVVCASNVPESCAGATQGSADVTKDAGVKVLESAGINHPSDIESVVLDFNRRDVYKITWNDEAELVTGLYEGIRTMEGYSGVPRLPPLGRLLLYVNSSRGLELEFLEMPLDTPSYVKVWPIYSSRDLAPVFRKIKRNAKAAARDGRVPPVEPVSLEVQMPQGERVAVSPTSEESKALLAKAVVMLDWFDPREVYCKPIKPEELEKLGGKYGLVYVNVAKPVSVLMNTTTVPYERWPEFRTDVSYGTITFDAFAVLDTGYVCMPQIALHDMQSGNYYLTQHYLYRREGERRGVEKFGLPGHPLTDEEYYKKPEVLYAELQALVERAAKDK
ncbi:MAG: hypothetical protein HYX78_09945 [Armatimonadetes bacterium]|nr:hypothetical protein [Armatimonadota bacterium]